MADKFDLKAMISLVDKFSPQLKVMNKHLNMFKRELEMAGKGGFAMGAGLSAGMAVQVKAFAQVENAAVGLQNTLMNNKGLFAGFEQINGIATELGNQLPGTAADFLNMASSLKGLGVDTESIAGGALKATAYLAVVGEKFGVTYEAAANAVGKVGNALGIAAKDLVPFADTIQRTLHLGVDLTEMQYSFAKLSPRLKSMGQQGLEVANQWAPLSAMLIRTGITGETAGTGLEKLLSGFQAAGKFKGVMPMVQELERLYKKMGAAKFSDFAKKQFGDEGERVASLIAAGGYEKILAQMREQADLQQRINNSLGTLTNLWEAATGTFTNAMAAFGAVYSPELKQLSKNINDISGGLMGWAKNNDTTIKSLTAMAGGFAIAKIATMGLSGALGILNAVTKMNPWILFGQLAVTAATMIYANWEPIADFFKENFRGAIETAMGAYKKFIDFIESSRGWLTDMFMMVDQTFSQANAPAAGGMRPPGYQKNGLIKAGRVGGAIDVNFNNTPAGTRITPATTGPVAVNPNVGYRTIGTGVP